jgi:hypothetical protein
MYLVGAGIRNSPHRRTLQRTIATPWSGDAEYSDLSGEGAQKRLLVRIQFQLAVSLVPTGLLIHWKTRHKGIHGKPLIEMFLQEF